MADFVALYRGRTVAEAELVAVSAEQHLVRRFFAELQNSSERRDETESAQRRPPILRAMRDE